MISFLKPEEQHQHKNGSGWVANTATVAGTAYIGPDARVFGDAQVFGAARVFGAAQVFDNAWKTSPLYIQGSKHALTNCAYGQIIIGCQVHSFSEWKKLYKKIGKENGYTAEQIKEYGLHIAHIAKVGK